MCPWESPHTFVMHAMLTQVSCIVPVGEPTHICDACHADSGLLHRARGRAHL